MIRRTVRAATLEVMRRQGMRTIFSNPGSTEVPFLVDLPDDLQFVLALHEASVVGIACGVAIATGEPQLVLLHTVAGLGNAVSAIATARVNHAPLVVVVGQQDRRHLALQPFLAGDLDGLAGGYPLDVVSPVLAQDVPSAIERAAHRARLDRGPVVVIVPMDDWVAAYDDVSRASAQTVVRADSADVGVDELAVLVRTSRSPAIVAGAGNDDDAGWSALCRLAESLEAPVWQEPFGARAGFPQDHTLFKGHLPADRPRARAALAGADLVIVVGAAALRQYPFTEGSLVPSGARIVVVTSDPDEAIRSPAVLAVVGPVAAVVTALADAIGAPPSPPAGGYPVRALPPSSRPVDPGDALTSRHVFGLLADLLPRDVVVVEETPSSRPLLQELVPARAPMGFVSAAMGGLGFAMPASIGIKMALPDRVVVAVVGDGSALYAIQSLWTAAHLGVGVLVVVMANGRYAVMDRLAEQTGGKPAWPAFPEVSVGLLARGLGCRVVAVERYDELAAALAEVVPRLGEPGEPLVLEVRVEPDEEFAP